MDIEEIKKRLRTPQKVVREQARQAEAAKAQAIKAAQKQGGKHPVFPGPGQFERFERRPGI